MLEHSFDCLFKACHWEYDDCFVQELLNNNNNSNNNNDQRRINKRVTMTS